MAAEVAELQGELVVAEVVAAHVLVEHCCLEHVALPGGTQRDHRPRHCIGESAQ